MPDVGLATPFEPPRPGNLAFLDAESVALVSLVRARNRAIWALREAARELGAAEG